MKSDSNSGPALSSDRSTSPTAISQGKLQNQTSVTLVVEDGDRNCVTCSIQSLVDLEVREVQLSQARTMLGERDEGANSRDAADLGRRGVTATGRLAVPQR